MVANDEEEKGSTAHSRFSLSFVDSCKGSSSYPSVALLPNKLILTSNTVLSRPMLAP